MRSAANTSQKATSTRWGVAPDRVIAPSRQNQSGRLCFFLILDWNASLADSERVGDARGAGAQGLFCLCWRRSRAGKTRFVFRPAFLYCVRFCDENKLTRRLSEGLKRRATRLVLNKGLMCCRFWFGGDLVQEAKKLDL